MQAKFFVFLLLLCYGHGRGLSQSSFLVKTDGNTFSLSERMAHYQVPGGSMAIVRNYEPDTALHLGSQDRENGIPVSDSTLFQMGSMTAPLAKFAVIRLVHDGRINLDHDVNEYLTSWQIPTKKFTQTRPVTVRDLLLERRGFRPVYKPLGYRPGEALPNLLQILAGEPPANTPTLKLEKDIAIKSSLANNILLQLLLEDIHGKPFPEIIQSEVFVPLEMTRSTITCCIAEQEDKQAATGYLEDGTRLPAGNWSYPELAHSGLWSNPVDYAKFISHIFRAAKGIDNTLISQKLALAGIRAQREYHSLILHQKEDGTSYWGGAPKGFYSQFAGNFEEGWVVVGCTNRELAWKFVNRELIQQGIRYAKQ